MAETVVPCPAASGDESLEDSGPSCWAELESPRAPAGAEERPATVVGHVPEGASLPRRRSFDLETDAAGSLPSSRPFSIKLPALEGPYELLATLRERKITAPVLVQSFRERRFTHPIVCERKVQLLVVDTRPAPIDLAAWREVDD